MTRAQDLAEPTVIYTPAGHPVECVQCLRCGQSWGQYMTDQERVETAREHNERRHEERAS